MNELSRNILDDQLLGYQAARFQSLLEEVLQCCQERTAFLSAKFDLPQAELRCLMLFGDARYLTAKSVAKRLDVTKSRVTKILDGLSRKKLIESIDDPQDARVKLIRLTPAGRAKCEEIGSFIRELFRKILLELGYQGRKDVLASLELLRTSMEAVKKQLF